LIGLFAVHFIKSEEVFLDMPAIQPYEKLLLKCLYSESHSKITMNDKKSAAGFVNYHCNRPHIE